MATSPTLVTPVLGIATVTTINGLTPTAQAVGFTLAGGATSKTLTIPLDASVSGTHTGTSSGSNTGDQTITLTGDVTGSGTGSFATAIGTGVIGDSQISASAGIVDTKLGTIATALKVSNSATTAASANTLSAIVARDASGNFSAGTITANLTGNVSGSSGSTTGNAATATALATGRTIAITGDLTYTSSSFDGTANVTAAGTLASVASAGTSGGSTAIPVVTINAKGLTTSITTAAVIAPAGTLTGATLASGVTASSLTSLGTIANLTATAGTISTTPSASTDIANKIYVDTVAQGLDAKASCVAATTADITLSGAQTIDGISVVAGNRVLVKNQTLSQNNGIYLCAAGAWTRTTDADTWDELTSAFAFIETGTVNADCGFVCTANAGGTLGTTALPWSQFSGAGSYTASTGLTLAGTVFSLTAPVTVALGGTNSTSPGIAAFNNISGFTASGATGTTSTNLVFSTSPTLVAPALGTPSELVGTNITGTAAGLTAGNVTTNANLTGGVTSVGNAATVVTNANLTGDVTSVGNATTLTNAPVIAKVLTGYTSGAGTVAATDSILQAIQKLNGNDATNANLTGVITSVGNATSIASQTGTGTKFVVDTSPVLITPNLGTPSAVVLTSATGLPLTTGVTGTLPVANGGTGVTTSTGTTNVVLSNSPTLVTPVLGTPSSGTLTSCTGLPISTGVSGLGTGIATALAVNVGTAGAPVVNGGALGTPTSGTVTNLTGTASININGTVGATTPSTVAATTLSASGASTFTNSAPSVIGGLSFRNRIINGDMRIDQRNEGASVVPSATTYLTDRWQHVSTQTSKITYQKNKGAVTPPAGFKNYLGATVTTNFTPISTDYAVLQQQIEGFNVADLEFGTANAKTITLSFQVYCSATGTFGGYLANASNNRTYPFTFSIGSANTWTSITVTVAGDTTGTWATGNTAGLQVGFSLGAGSSRVGTAGAWAGATYLGATGQVNLVETLNANFFLTGVQLEVGNAAIEFERKPYGQELALCQRYYWKTFPAGTAPAQNAGFVGAFGYRAPIAGASINTLYLRHPVPMRTTPTATYYNPGAANSNWRNRSLTADSGASADVVDIPSADAWGINNGQAVGDAVTNLLCLQAAFNAEI